MIFLMLTGVSMPKPLVICDNLVKIYKVADLEVVALQGLNLEVMQGEMMAIVGVSGSGKTTLLNILSSLDVPSAGKCVVNGYDLTRLSQAQRIHYERYTVGHVWQQSGRNLLPELSIQENVELPQVLGGANSARRDRKSTRLNSSHSQISYAVFCLKKKIGAGVPVFSPRIAGPAATRGSSLSLC